MLAAGTIKNCDWHRQVLQVCDQVLHDVEIRIFLNVKGHYDDFVGGAS